MLALLLSVVAAAVFVGPSVHDFARLVAALAPMIGISLALGVIVAMVSPRERGWPFAVSAILGLVFYHAVLWWQADPDVWSWRDPITSEVYQFVPAVLFCAAPALLGTIIVRLFSYWRHAKRI